MEERKRQKQRESRRNRETEKVKKRDIFSNKRKCTKQDILIH